MLETITLFSGVTANSAVNEKTNPIFILTAGNTGFAEGKNGIYETPKKINRRGLRDRRGS